MTTAEWQRFHLERLLEEKNDALKLARCWRLRHNRKKGLAARYRAERDSLRKELKGTKIELRRLEVKHKALRLYRGPA